jgi:hypothetical protein
VLLLRKWGGSVTATYEPADTVPTSLLSKIFTAAELEYMEFDPLVEFVPGMVTEGFGIIAGPPKLGKSWFVLYIALAIALGGKALGRIKVEKRPVLLLALEDSRRRLKRRCKELLAVEKFPDGLHILTAADIGPGLVIGATIREWLLGNPGGLVVLDTLGKARPQRRAGDDPYIADYQFGSQLKALVDEFPGSALLAVHHTRKMLSEDFLDALSGTQGIAGSADFVLVLRRKRKSSEGVLSVTGRDIEEDEYALKVENCRWELDGPDIRAASKALESRREQAATESKLGSQSLDAMKFVNSRESTSPAELSKHLGIDNRVAGNLLARLHDGGYIDKPHRGAYAPVPDESDESDENPGQVADSSPGNSLLSSDSSPDDVGPLWGDER